MAWEWSHSQEAYDNAQKQLMHLDRETREVIAAEWLAAYAHNPRFGISFHAELNLKKYNKSIVRVKQWADQKLNSFIWGLMQKLATCTNGGWEAYCCPFGCMGHMVPFDPPEEVVEEKEEEDTYCEELGYLDHLNKLFFGNDN